MFLDKKVVLGEGSGSGGKQRDASGEYLNISYRGGLMADDIFAGWDHWQMQREGRFDIVLKLKGIRMQQIQKKSCD